MSEVAQEYKGRWAIVQPHAVDRLQDLRDDLGALAVNSGYRNVTYNAGVGGSTSSRHIYGDAFDLDPVSATLTELADACEDHGAGYVGVYTTHIHCDWRDDALEEAFFGPASASSSTRTAARPPHLDAHIASGIDGTLIAPAVGWDEGEPLREWIAYDVQGRAVARHVGSRFAPPADATSVEVTVGRALTRRLGLTP